MLLNRLLYFLILIQSLGSISLAQKNDRINNEIFEYTEKDSWEPDDLESDEVLWKESKNLISPFSSFSISLIRIYQKKISPNSTIHRCPYKTSCSNFAYRCILERGFFVGILLFIDRYYYRENSGVPYRYPLYEDKEGILKLNDDYYFTGKTY